MRVFVCAALALLFSCAGPDEENVVTLSGSTVGREGAVLERQIARFIAENEGITVRIQPTPDDATQRHQLYVQWLNAHVGSPDVLQLDVVWTAEFAAAGWILPLGRSRRDSTDFFAAALDSCRWRDELYAVPWFVDVGMLYWRTDLLRAAPQTLEELNGDASPSVRPPKVPYGIVWQGARYEGLVTVYVEILSAFGGSILTPDGRVALRSPAAIRALTYLRDQLRQDVAPREVLTWHEEESRFAFQNGNAVFMRNWPYAVTMMNDPAKSSVAGRFSVAPMPRAAGGKPSATLGGATLAVNTWSRHPDAALRLVEFLTAPRQMVERARIAGQYPARVSAFDDPSLARTLGASPAQLHEIISAAVPRPVTPIWTELSEELQVALHRTLTGEAEPADALESAARRLQKLLDENGLRRDGP